MRTLYELCVPRESVFDETKRDDVLDLSDLIENRIDPYRFFEETYITDGMRVLFDTAFKRFHRQTAAGVIKLRQSMGGGKTHNMIALGLLARYPDLREKVLGDKFKDSPLGRIKVVAFTGRESDAPYGIWGAIAEQLGKREMFKDYYSPLQAPGQSAWVNLLRGEPLLILLDELPPYLENAKAKLIGESNLAVVTTTALANLFNALNKEELSNVCLVISDLRAVYESGSELLQSSFRELENEVNRLAIEIEPVSLSTDEIYHILRKRLFKQLPSEEEINEVALAYKKAVIEAKQMGYTNLAPDQIYNWIKESYPFHPSLRDLYARFKENPGFQQTRGLLRLMRIVVSQLYKGDNPKAKYKYLIHPYDFDLNDHEMLTAITQIKPSLANAIAHDIASNGHAIAEEIDSTIGETHMQDLAKLILVSSLADVPNALLGLSIQETVGYLCEPGKDITRVKKALDEFVMRAWYLHTDRDGKLYFKNTRNLIAELNSLVESYDNESAKKELRNFLEKIFEPKIGDCYQRVLVFPAVDEIRLSEDKVTLVIFEPYIGGTGLHPDLKEFYDNERYKNRVMFLSGSRSTMEKLLRAAKEHRAINEIISRMENEEKVPASDPQYQRALEKRDRIVLELLQAARETFTQIYYPTKEGLIKADFLMEFRSNEYNGEKQIRDLLEKRQKFTYDTTSDIFRKKCEDRLFTQKEMRWSDVKERAATNPAWQWHHPSALDKLKDEMLRKGIWREHGGYIEKGPFPKEKTSVQIRELRRDEQTGEVILKIIPLHGDKVYYEVGSVATTASNLVENLNEFRTKEVKLSFLCVDSTGEHETGEPVLWINKLELKYRTYNKGSDEIIELKAVPPATIKYTTDGSNPKENGGIYEGEFIVPQNCTYVLAVAEKEGVYSDVLQIKIDRERGVKVDASKPLTLKRRIKTSDTRETYEEIGLLKKCNAKISDASVLFFTKEDSSDRRRYVEVTLDLEVDIDKLERSIESIRENFMNDKEVTIIFESNSIHFATGQDFLDWVAGKKLELKNFKQGEIVQQ
ncbi:Predicted ATPase, AAA+ superfamily [Fervidobacterium changbaicum]|uniref:DUF499 domain-containing protein n=2 Tax=Fervidobacterium TaxID=2422 RepID=A0AAI8CLK7_FERIS|nr:MULTISPECIES: DUF499 domain-containing protein [Fervidobacterium]AMW32750.1 DUF499 domain-containing protein [Fervidobacterium islandicum]QAV32786.1 DUF499 domain-containing protein [Fervidobacterium changbaicum]SDG95583.1 Predicted ATPase, AAA+ superfamily [Fervidobacterium changbaicum]